MIPGLLPGLLIKSAVIRLIGAPQLLWIDTRGGNGNRSLGLSLTLEGGVGPFFYEWAINIGGFTATPASGFGNTASPYVGFSTNVYVEGGETSYTQVGDAYLQVTGANGATSRIDLPVWAGGNGPGG